MYGAAAEHECRDFRVLNISDVCSFVVNTSDCQIDDGFLDYVELVYCKFGVNLVPLGAVVFFLWWLFLFCGLANTADGYFCPSLTVISKTLRLGQSTAGVTFLAFGNGSCDVFSALSAIRNSKNGDAGLAIGALVGAGIFVTTIVAGAISVTTPFYAMERPLLRDIIFYIGAIFFTFYIMYDGLITLGESVGFICLYVGYIIVVVVSAAVYKAMKKKKDLREEDADTDETEGTLTDPLVFESSQNSYGTIQSPESESLVPADVTHQPGVKIINESPHQSLDPSHQSPDPSLPDADLLTDPLLKKKKKKKAVSYLAIVAETVGVSSMLGSETLTNQTLRPSGLEDQNTTSSSMKDDSVPKDIGVKTIFTDFFQGVCPIDVDNWKKFTWYKKFYEVFKCPLVLCCTLTVPVVDYDEKLHNWNKLLNSLHCTTAPVFAVFAVRAAFNPVGMLPAWALALIIGAAFSVIVFLTSQQGEPPRYHWAFAYIGFVMAVIWIYILCNEIVNLLQMFGVVFNLSSAVLGLTLLAWGNSIGDLISDTVMARQGFARMAISACYGGPLFNLLLGIGLPFTVAIIQQGTSFQLRFNLLEGTLFAFIIISLLSTLIFIPLRRFHFNRCYGIYLFILYLCFIVIALLVETNVISVKV